MGRLTFRGVHPTPRKEATRRKPIIAPAQPPKQVFIPLDVCCGSAPAIPTVKPGDRVLMGQIIAKPGDENGVWLHASVSGQVTAIAPHPHPWGDSSPAIVIENDGRDAPPNQLPPPLDCAHMIPQKLIDRVREAGIVGMGGDASPTHRKLAQALGKADTLIVNSAECEPYVTADQRLLADHGEQILQGAQELGRALRLKRVVLAAEGDQIRTVEKLERVLLRKKTSLELLTLHARYPLGSEKQLVQAVNGREVPPGGTALDVNCLVLNVATVYAIQDAIAYGRPLTHRAVTVTGGAVERPRNLWAPIGTPMSHLISCVGGLKEEEPLILTGGPMRGVPQKDLSAPILMDTDSIVCMTRAERADPGPETPCVRCGRCAASCPMRLVPAFIARAVRLNQPERLPALHPQDCLACGSCTFICPSQIPLMTLVQQANHILAEGGDRK